MLGRLWHTTEGEPSEEGAVGVRWRRMVGDGMERVVEVGFGAGYAATTALVIPRLPL